MSNKVPEASVCICTYNRSTSLLRTLQSLAKMSAPDDNKWELVIIDNNSNDDTQQVAKSFAIDLPLNYFFEQSQGLSYARNRAIRECRGDLLIFTDDDVEVDKAWLKEFLRASELFPQADFFGGKVIPKWQNGRPRWLRDENMPLLGGLFLSYDQGSRIRMYEPDDPTPYGANFALRRRLFQSIEPFRTDLGVTGNTPGRSEEGEYLSRAKQMGLKGAYVGTAICHHWVHRSRLNLSYMYRYGMQKGIAEIRMNRFTRLNGSFRRELNYAIRGLWQLAKGRGDRFRQCVINMGIQAGIRRDARDKDLAQ